MALDMSKVTGENDWIAELVGDNLLAVLDVALDLEKELQLSEGDVDVPLLQNVVRFRQLFPMDSISMRDQYCKLRWQAAELLRRRGVIREIKQIPRPQRWENRLRISVDRPAFDEVLAALRAEYKRRTASAGSQAEGASIPSQGDALSRLRGLILRFHSVVIQLRQRHDGRPTLDVTDEYDVQDLLHALLRLGLDDIRPEEWTPSYAGRASRADFLLKPEKMVVEVKKTRRGLGAGEVGEELVIDIARYSKMPDCETLVCFVYDPENRVANPEGLQSDLSGEKEGIQVDVIVVPKRS